MNNSDTESVLKEGLENQLNSDDKPLYLSVPEANYHVAENPITQKYLEERSSKGMKEVRKIKEKDRGKEKGKGKEKDKGKIKGKSKEK